jgi:hypothetical protein
MFGLFKTRKYPREYELILQKIKQRKDPTDLNYVVNIIEVAKLYSLGKGGYLERSIKGYNFILMYQYDGIYISSAKHDFLIQLLDKQIKLTREVSASTDDILDLILASGKFEGSTRKLNVTWESLPMNGARLAHRGKLSALLAKLESLLISDYRVYFSESRKTGKFQAKDRAKGMKDLEKNIKF